MTNAPPSSRHRRTRPPLRADEWLLIAFALIVTFTGHILYGANKVVLGLVYAGACALLLIGTLASDRFSGELWVGRKTLVIPVVLFSTVVLITAHPLYLNNRGEADLGAVTLETIKLLGLGCIFLVGCVIGARTRRADTFLVATALGLGLYAIFALAAFKLAPTSLLFGPKLLFLDRLTGTFGSANSAATLLGVGVVLNVAVALKRPRSSSEKGQVAVISALAIGGAIMCAGALILSASRGGLLATIFGAVALLGFWMWKNPNRISWKAVAAAFACMLAGSAVFFSSDALLSKRFAQFITADRAIIFEAHYAAMWNRPLFGYGLGSFDSINKSIMTPGNYESLWNVRATHNVFLQWAEEVGLVASSIAAALIIWLLGAAVLATSRSNNHLPLATIAVSLVVLIHGLSDYGLQNPSISGLWTLLLGATAAALSHGRGTSSGSRLG